MNKLVVTVLLLATLVGLVYVLMHLDSESKADSDASTSGDSDLTAGLTHVGRKLAERQTLELRSEFPLEVNSPDELKVLSKKWRLDVKDSLEFTKPTPEFPVPMQGYGRLTIATVTSAFPSVGLLLKVDSATPEGNPRCSGTLVGFDTFVSAAHCLEAESDYLVYLQHAGLFPVKKARGYCEEEKGVAYPCSPDGYHDALHDLAVFKLDLDSAGSDAVVRLVSMPKSSIGVPSVWSGG